MVDRRHVIPAKLAEAFFGKTDEGTEVEADPGIPRTGTAQNSHHYAVLSSRETPGVKRFVILEDPPYAVQYPASLAIADFSPVPNPTSVAEDPALAPYDLAKIGRSLRRYNSARVSEWVSQNGGRIERNVDVTSILKK